MGTGSQKFQQLYTQKTLLNKRPNNKINKGQDIPMICPVLFMNKSKGFKEIHKRKQYQRVFFEKGV